MTTTSSELLSDCGERRLRAHVVSPNSSGEKTAVIIFHAWHGRSDFECSQAQRLADLGYVGIAADLYGDARVGADREENTAMISPYLADRAMLRSNLLAVLESVRGLANVDENRIVVMGYCFGGLCALDLARSGANVAGAVSLHGLLTAPEGLESRPVAPVLVLHGHRDPMVPVDQVAAFEAEMDAAECDWQLHVYGRAMHAFTLPGANDVDFGTVYDARTDGRAWQTLLNFINEVS